MNIYVLFRIFCLICTRDVMTHRLKGCVYYSSITDKKKQTTSDLNNFCSFEWMSRIASYRYVSLMKNIIKMKQTLTTSSTSAILVSTSLFRFLSSGTDFRNAVFSCILWIPVRIIRCWKIRRSSTHTRELVSAVDIFLVFYVNESFKMNQW